MHAATSSPFYNFDEASAIPNKISEVAEGGLTDGEPFWFAFGKRTAIGYVVTHVPVVGPVVAPAVIATSAARDAVKPASADAVRGL